MNTKVYIVNGNCVVGWTPSFVMVRSASLWKDAKGKPLTNRKILQYERDGRYGPEAQRLTNEANAALTLRAKKRRVRNERNRQEREREQREQDVLTAKYV